MIPRSHLIRYSHSGKEDEHNHTAVANKDVRVDNVEVGDVGVGNVGLSDKGKEADASDEKEENVESDEADGCEDENDADYMYDSNLGLDEVGNEEDVKIDDLEFENTIEELLKPDYGSDSDVEEKNKQHRIPRGPVYNPSTKMSESKLVLGMQFTTFEQFKDVVRDYAIIEGLNLHFRVNEPLRCQFECLGFSVNGICEWTCWCSNIIGEKAMHIKSFGEDHTCGRVYKNKLVSAKWLAKRIENKVRNDVGIKVPSLCNWIKDKFKVEVPSMQVYRAKKLAMEKIHGNAVEQYNRLRDYLNELRRTNVGSTCQVQVNRDANDKPIFKRVYICLAALKQGFLEGCRPLIGLNGYFLKGVYGGQLLTAVAQDANNAIFPFAWAVVDKEDIDNWEWFMTRLIGDIGDQNWSFITDKQKRLMHVFEHSFSGLEHRLCAKHMYANFEKKFKGVQLRYQFFQIVKYCTIPEFEFELLRMKTMDEAAWKWLDEKKDQLWSKAKFRTHSKNDTIVNNLYESYNSKILKHRSKPIITLFEELRVESMKRFVEKKLEIIDMRDNIAPKVKKLIDKSLKETRRWTVLWSGDNDHTLFEVSMASEKYIVHLLDGQCSCRRWDHTGIPCVHSLVAIQYNGLDILSFVSNFYSKETYLKAYGNILYPINSVRLWQKTSSDIILPPAPRKAMGRPKMKRRRDENEVKPTGKLKRAYTVVRCSNCGQTGHNIRKCKK